MAQPAHNSTSNTDRLEARISADKKYILKSAADLSDQTLTDFVINSAYEAAVRLIEDYQQLRLSMQDRDVFIQALLNPPSPSKQLLKAAKKYKKDVISK
ncbi:hypothetical protein AYO45_03985 [Gammaproteobacteria bacterium SCGC AG-212-F23]|nr:hypothetical protein AYO45_03985 [Gammaproteobacteria bacterium SCGC AG-212-F23]